MDDTTVYKQSFATARDNGEVGLFHESNERSAACSAAIDKAVADSNYKTNFYDLKTAARTVIGEYGADRVAWVLAAMVERSFNDGRYSNANREWAKDFDVPKDVQGCRVQTHPYVLDGFIDEARKIFDVLSKEDHALSKKPALDAAKPSVLARLQEGKRAATQEQDRPKTAPKHDNNREV